MILIYYFGVIKRTVFTFVDQEMVYLTWPLVLAAVIVLLFGIRELSVWRQGAWKWRKNTPFCSFFLLLVIFTAMVWAGVVAFFYDYHLIRKYRDFMYQVTAVTTALVQDDSLIFTDFSVPLYGVGATRERIRIASPVHDKFKDFQELLKFHSQQGRPVYGSFQSWARWQLFTKDGLFDGFELVALHKFPKYNIILCQIRPKT